MSRSNAVVIGAGHAGLAMSRCLSLRGISHVVLERGRIAERWRSERWDSLRLLTPNWHTRLPDWRYLGDDPDGYMTASEFVSFLEAYGKSFDAPVRTGVTVESVERDRDGFRVRTGSRSWNPRAVVIATGHCDVPFVPSFAENLNPEIVQLTSPQYRNPGLLPPGGVLVVGACASGVQIAEELVGAGRRVTLSVSRHRRAPRRYRGRDILWWVEHLGIYNEPADPRTERDFPAPQLVGSDDGHSLDLGVLQARGVRLAGRVAAVDDYRVRFASNLEQEVERAEQQMRELLARIDAYADARDLGGIPTVLEPVRPRPSPPEIDLRQEGVRTVVWATGYRRVYPWLRLNLLDERGEIRHRGGVTEEPGVYVIGLRRQRRNNSNFIDGVGDDAAVLADHLLGYLAGRPEHP
jgi:putative flavoprotein involved in K+ transport